MSTYFIGDVQGCFDELMTLLDRINYNPKIDRLGFVGDLVNRGPKSLEVLRFIKSQKSAIVVLGNHDLHLLAVGYGMAPPSHSDTLNEILTAPDRIALLDWLRQQHILYRDKTFCCVHAGIPPQWSIDEAQQHAQELESTLRGNNFKTFLNNMHGNLPLEWNQALTGIDRLRYITNAFTRMRLCTSTGKLELATKDKVSSDNPELKPWFEWTNTTINIVFGHWAALQGQCSNKRCYAIDTGCVWGNKLTAIDIDTKQRISN